MTLTAQDHPDWHDTARRHIGLTALCLFAFTSKLEAQSIEGRVVDEERSQPVAFALVQLFASDGSPAGSMPTDSEGRFRIATPPAGGLFRLTVETLFHRPAVRDSVRVGVGESVDLGDIRLELVPIGLDSVTVDVGAPRLTPGSEWLRRNQQHGRGSFLSGQVIALQARASLAEYVAVRTNLWLRYDERSRPTFVNPSGAVSRCVEIFVNRWKLERTGFTSFEAIPRSQIAAIEVYNSERDLPPGYYFDATPGCGLVNVCL
jgi:hypothetical protein